MKNNNDNEMVYLNYRCRRCDEIFSKETPKRILGTKLNSRGAYSSNKSKFHNCSKAIEQEEHVLYDLISWSTEPLEGAELTKWTYKEGENGERANNEDK